VKSLRLTVTHTDATIDPMHALVCESPAVDRVVILEGRADGGTETVVCHLDGDAAAFAELLASAVDPREYDVTPDGDDGFFLYLRQDLGADGERLLEALAQETVVVASPIEFRADRTMRLTLVGHADDLGAVLDELPDELDVGVERVGSYATAVGDGLTARQREAVAAAWDAGYYEVPREGDVEDVAAALDCAVSTASTLLRRAESRLVAAALGTGD
jgi:hypothetical protein